MQRAHALRRLAVVLAALSLLALAACGDDDDDSGGSAATTATTAAAGGAATTAAAGGAGATEVIKGIAFTEKEIHVGLGGQVVFDNQDSTTHTATADDGSFDTGNIAAGSKSTITFASAGTFAFHCKIHPSMKASVVVA